MVGRRGGRSTQVLETPILMGFWYRSGEGNRGNRIIRCSTIIHRNVTLNALPICDSTSDLRSRSRDRSIQARRAVPSFSLARVGHSMLRSSTPEETNVSIGHSEVRSSLLWKKTVADTRRAWILRSVYSYVHINIYTCYFSSNKKWTHTCDNVERFRENRHDGVSRNERYKYTYINIWLYI